MRGTRRNHRLTLALAAAFAALALLVAGCGGASPGGGSAQGLQNTIREFGSKASGPQARRAAAALHGYLDARGGGEWDRACSYLAKPLRRGLDRIAAKSKQVKDRGCAGFVETSTKKLPPSVRAGLAKAHVSSVRVEGDRGYVLYKDADRAERAVPIKIEDARWRLNLINGLPLTK